MISRQIARRTLLTQTGFGLGAAIGAGFGPGLEPAEAKAGPGGDVWSQGYRADKGGVTLAMYRKWPGNLGGWPDKPLPVLFLVHGSSLSAQSSFDLGVPGSEYSMMNVFARSGFDVWTMDHENYGRSSQTSLQQKSPAAVVCGEEFPRRADTRGELIRHFRGGAERGTRNP
jgi:pimeloyl-ACP methyl ester carboxylesterase